MEKMNTDLGKYNKEQFVKGLANVKTNKFVICFGSTKAGKSSFINKIDKKKEATVSNDDKSSTFHAMDYSIVHPIEGNYLCKQLFGSDVVILDSRGFSDSGGSEDSATTCRLFQVIQDVIFATKSKNTKPEFHFLLFEQADDAKYIKKKRKEAKIKHNVQSLIAQFGMGIRGSLIFLATYADQLDNDEQKEAAQYYSQFLNEGEQNKIQICMWSNYKDTQQYQQNFTNAFKNTKAYDSKFISDSMSQVQVRMTATLQKYCSSQLGKGWNVSVGLPTYSDLADCLEDQKDFTCHYAKKEVSFWKTLGKAFAIIGANIGTVGLINISDDFRDEMYCDSYSEYPDLITVPYQIIKNNYDNISKIVKESMIKNVQLGGF